MAIFKNREDAARELAEDLTFLRNDQPLVLGIPNYGVPIAAVIAQELNASLDILLIAKLAAPRAPQQIVGAVDEHGRISMIQSAARWHHLTARQMIGPARSAFADLQSRRACFRAVMPETDVRGRTVVIVDHGVETGAKMLGAIASARDRGARRVIAAAPAGCGRATWQLREAADAVVIPHSPSRFKGIKHFYSDFEEIEDEVVVGILKKWAVSSTETDAGIQTLHMRLVGNAQQVLHCEVDLPRGAVRGGGPFPAVIFAHGLESDSNSPRTLPISRRLAQRGVMGVRPDFTGHGRSEGRVEDATDDRMLSDLATVYDNIRILDEVDAARIGINGSGGGGMIALHFAAQAAEAANGPGVAALVIRGPASGGEIEAAHRITAPTLLIHGERDTYLSVSVHALDQELAGPHQLLEIPDSDRLFNDPVSRELMVSASVDWLADHLIRREA